MTKPEKKEYLSRIENSSSNSSLKKYLTPLQKENINTE
jgi:hypothetical protein